MVSGKGFWIRMQIIIRITPKMCDLRVLAVLFGIKVLERVRKLVELHFSFVRTKKLDVALHQPQFLLVKIRENDGHSFFMKRLHELVWIRGERRERIFRLPVLMPGAPKPRESEWLFI